MKSNKLFNKFLVASALLLGTGLTSCEDFLTVLPSNQITEDDFWKNSSDLNNVRSAAYKQMATSAVTDRIVYWGELRSDNVAQNEMTNTNIELLRKGVLHPTNGMWSWEGFYKGINYCNKVLEKGEQMTVPGKEIDPSFRRGDWLPIKAEMLSLRALYYLDLVRAFRNVPYVEKSISTDAEALNSKDPATLGVVILGKMIDQLEEAKAYAAEDYSSARERKGRFTKRSVHALLADLHMWRGCMLKHAMAKGDTISVVTEGNVVDTLTQKELDAISADDMAKVIEHCDYIMAQLQADYEEDLIENPTLADDKNRNKDYPYMLFMHTFSQKSASDNVYNNVFGNKNSEYESVFELQYDGEILNNSTYNTYFGQYSSGSFKPSAMVGAAEMTSSVESNYDPDKGFGKADIRLCETFMYTAAQSQRSPIHKNVIKNVIIPDLLNVASDETHGSSSYRSSGSQDANWPVYRLSDIMLLKAEAIARSTAADVKGSTEGAAGKQLIEGFNLVNSLFARCNPGLKPKGTTSAGDAVSERLIPAKDYAKERHASDLLTLVYNERQREFIGEGKRWYDIVRQVEATNNVENTLTSFISLTKEVRSRLRSLWAMYVPIYSEELKVNGVEFGGGLRQNPVWDRYTVK